MPVIGGGSPSLLWICSRWLACSTVHGLLRSLVHQSVCLFVTFPIPTGLIMSLSISMICVTSTTNTLTTVCLGCCITC